MDLTGSEFSRGFSESLLHRCWAGQDAPIKLPASDLRCLQDLLSIVVRQRSQSLNVLTEVLLMIYLRDLNPFMGLSHRLGSVTWELRADCCIFRGQGSGLTLIVRFMACQSLMGKVKYQLCANSLFCVLKCCTGLEQILLSPLPTHEDEFHPQGLGAHWETTMALLIFWCELRPTSLLCYTRKEGYFQWIREWIKCHGYKQSK